MTTRAPETTKSDCLHRTLRVPADDRYPLGVSIMDPPSAARGTVIVHGATATPARFYAPFAGFLAASGIRVIRYDYRGVGLSRPESLRGFAATMDDWARDAVTIHRFVASRYPDDPVAIVGHSFGGQLIGLVDELQRTMGAVTVGAQFGYYGHWPILSRAKLAFTWNALVPALTTTFGYLPGRAGLGEDLPKGVAAQWARWCQSPDYFIVDHPDAAERLATFDRPLRAYTFTDDDYAPEGAVDNLLRRLESARLDHRRVRPSEVGKAAIGHFGFFRRGLRDTLWAEAKGFLDDVLAGREPADRGAPPSSDNEGSIRVRAA
jgi:predicted alpha/beta hydrolase